MIAILRRLQSDVTISSLTYAAHQTRTQSLFMSLGERERRLDLLRRAGCHGKGRMSPRSPQWNPIFYLFPPDS